MNTPTLQTQMMVLDEAGYYFGRHNDGLKEQLRMIDGIPNAAYLVKDGRVFVFDKLVQKVNEYRKHQPDAPLAALARILVQAATVSAKEAVDNWGIVPEPYEVVSEHSSRGLRIRHRLFNALLPGAFETERDVQDALAILLLGGVRLGSGDFTYRGQPMTLCDSLDPALLPPRPTIQAGTEPTNWVYTAMGSVSYEPGFEPVSEAVFDRVKELEGAWKDDCARASLHVHGHAAEIWARAEGIRLEMLNDPTDEVLEYGQQDFTELRGLYPEMSMLSDGSLYGWFDRYQMECRFINGWTAARDDEFLFYLLGKVAGPQYERETSTAVGEWVAYAMLMGDSLDAAIAFGQAAALYDSAIVKMAHRVADAMRFLAEDKKVTDLRGRAITTMMDMFRVCRKFSKPVSREQKFGDFQ